MKDECVWKERDVERQQDREMKMEQRDVCTVPPYKMVERRLFILVRNTVVKWVTKIHCLCRWINPTDAMKVALIVSQLSGTCILYLTYLSISLNLFEKKRA